jgi:hypothetical protein
MQATELILELESASNFNKVYGNFITNSKTHAILVNNGSSSNTFYSNKIIGATPNGLKIEQDPTSKNNVFNNNQIASHIQSAPLNLHK